MTQSEQKPVVDHSYGIIPVIKHDDGWRVYVLHEISRRGDRLWTFPKGHPEAGEAPLDTARRELQEEAGIELVSLNTQHTFEQVYSFEQNGETIEKHVTYYLGYAATEDFTTQPEEVAEARWCTFTEARSLLTFDLAKQTLDEVATFLAAA